MYASMRQTWQIFGRDVIKSWDGESALKKNTIKKTKSVSNPVYLFSPKNSAYSFRSLTLSYIGNSNVNLEESVTLIIII